jgi:DNA-binding winged helix-turn-helix (wHTH) protein/tetratricopeptide (TPR) repeat protein
MPRERYRIADLTVDVAAASVTRQDGQAVELPQLSFDLLVALARRAPDVVSSDELIATVWNGTAVSDETLTQRVALLRRSLGDQAKSPRYLRAVRGRGYQIVPSVVALSEEERPRRWIGPAVTAAALVAFGFLLYILLSLYGRAQIRDGEANAVSTRTASVPELLARAGAYLRQHQERDNELAIELYHRALRLEPENPLALAGLSLAHAQRATKFNGQGAEREQAVQLARKALALDPRLGLAHHALGMALDSRGQVTPALTSYLRAAELERDPTAALASAAYLLQVQGHLADALEGNVHATREGGEAPVYLEAQLGATLALLGFEEAAAVWFERALELRPDNVFAPSSYAQMRLSQGRIREADEIAARAIARGLRRPEPHAIRGAVALMEGDEPRAEAFFRDALAVDRDHLRAKTRLLLLAWRRSPADPDLERRRGTEVNAIRLARAEGDEWPDSAIDAAIGLGYRDADWLLLDPMLAGLRRNPGFAARIERIRRLVAAERQRVVGAAWLPPSLLDPAAARM